MLSHLEIVILFENSVLAVNFLTLSDKWKELAFVPNWLSAVVFHHYVK